MGRKYSDGWRDTWRSLDKTDPAPLNLFFNGSNYSLFCPLTSEIAALWIVARLGPSPSPLPPATEQRKEAWADVTWMRTRTGGHHARGASLVPFSMSYVDELLGDLGVGIGCWAGAKEWVWPVDPRACEGFLARSESVC